MRKTKIVLWSVIAALLILLLTVLLLLPQRQTSSLFGSIYRYGDSEGYTAGGGSLSAEGVTALSVDWLNGSVELLPSSDGLFHVEESASRTCDDAELLHMRIANGVLSVKYAKSGTSILHLTKALTVRVPQGLLERLDVDTVSADIRDSGVSAPEAELQTVSGGIQVSDASIKTLTLGTVSGGIRADNVLCNDITASSTSGSISLVGDTEEIALDSVSGDLTFEVLAKAPRSIRTESTSGNIKLCLPASVGFTAQFSSVSGDFSSDLAASKNNNIYTAGDGGIEIHASTVSGDLKIQKK